MRRGPGPGGSRETGLAQNSKTYVGPLFPVRWTREVTKFCSYFAEHRKTSELGSGFTPARLVILGENSNWEKTGTRQLGENSRYESWTPGLAWDV